jgi:hypothetical protein
VELLIYVFDIQTRDLEVSNSPLMCVSHRGIGPVLYVPLPWVSGLPYSMMRSMFQRSHHLALPVQCCGFCLCNHPIPWGAHGYVCATLCAWPPPERLCPVRGLRASHRRNVSRGEDLRAGAQNGRDSRGVQGRGTDAQRVWLAPIPALVQPSPAAPHLGACWSLLPPTPTPKPEPRTPPPIRLSLSVGVCWASKND